MVHSASKKCPPEALQRLRCLFQGTSGKPLTFPWEKTFCFPLPRPRSAGQIWPQSLHKRFSQGEHFNQWTTERQEKPRAAPETERFSTNERYSGLNAFSLRTFPDEDGAERTLSTLRVLAQVISLPSLLLLTNKMPHSHLSGSSCRGEVTLELLTLASTRNTFPRPCLPGTLSWLPTGLSCETCFKMQGTIRR